MLLSAERRSARRAEIESSSDLRRLAGHLLSRLSPILGDDLYFPEQQALLSRDGGVCPEDGSRLAFDPLSPSRHSCPMCNGMFEGDRHHRAWVWRYHIWLSERAIHLALLGNLRHDESLLKRAGEILEGYAARYRDYPNADNVLGPARLFFSTYLESIWLSQLVFAALLVRSAERNDQFATADWSEFDRMVDESADLIGSFNEGWSNRQVWNNVALVGAGLWLSLSSILSSALHGSCGLLSQLVSCVSDEGLWREGENYHFFALRGFLFASEMLREHGVDLYGADAPAGRLNDMLVAPLNTALPDLTVPARGDSPYGVSLLQPRFAELWEVGWARTGDARLESVLTDLYASDVAVGEDPGLSEMSEQEQNRPAQRLCRDRLGWKALWCMRPTAPNASRDLWQQGATLMPDSGLAVLRTGAGRYVSIECGGRPGGHGHPDLLHLTLFWNRPILADFGTGSYVSESLFWYRSTLAHNAPGVSGLGQLSRDATCVAFEAEGEWAWCRSVADGLLGEASQVTRTVVVGLSYVLDQVEVTAPDDVVTDLPLHFLSDPGRLPGSRRPVADRSVSSTLARNNIFVEPRPGEKLLLSEGPGPPDIWLGDGSSLRFLIRRAGGSGVWRQIWLVGDEPPTRIETSSEAVSVVYDDGSVDRILIRDRECRITDRHGRLQVLRGSRERRRPLSRPRPTRRGITCPMLSRVPVVHEWPNVVPGTAVVELGESQYRRSEIEWGAAGEFRARVAVFACADELCFAADVVKSQPYFRSSGDPDPALDNEDPDIHSDGLQCYVDSGGWTGYLAVPEGDSKAVRVKAVGGAEVGSEGVVGDWEPNDAGYRVLVRIKMPRPLRAGDRIPVNLIVNEMYPWRGRRAGQLALSGGGGWVYLRGDRESPDAAVIAEVS